MTPLLALDNISIHYGQQQVVEALSCHVNPGDIVSLLGPSGCGKTTTLRAIAGFEPISGGEIRLEGNLLSDARQQLPPEERHLGMVFQDYALFPHLNLYDNICFGLGRSVDRQQVCNRLLELVNLPGLERRYPHELSGGQQQRVALARALAPQPKLLLLDEPFSNLDVDLRRRLAQEVREILKREGISAILVTHDQEEAFAFADKVGVMRGGRLLQWDQPYQLYHEPADRFVANFIGQGHFIPATAIDPQQVDTELGTISGNRAYAWEPGTALDLLLRPDDLIYCAQSPYQARILRKTFIGAITQYRLQLDSGLEVDALLPSHHDFAPGARIGIAVASDNLVAFERRSAA